MVPGSAEKTESTARVFKLLAVTVCLCQDLPSCWLSLSVGALTCPVVDSVAPQEEALVASLARQSAEEQRFAERMWQLRQEKEAMKEDRLLREQQYRERREKDW